MEKYMCMCMCMHMCMYMLYLSADSHPPPTEGVINNQPIFRFLGVIFDGDHDFEGHRSPIAHLDTVLRKPVTPPGHPPYHVPCIMDLPVLFVCSYLLSSVLTMYPVACCHVPSFRFTPRVVDAMCIL